MTIEEVATEMALEQIINQEGVVTVLRKLSANTEIEDLILKTPSAQKFRKLGEKHGLVIQVQGSLCHVSETHYLSKSKTHNVGDVKDLAHEYRMFSMTLTNEEDFAIQARWYEQFPKFRDGTPKPSVMMFDSAHVGGPRTAYPRGTTGYFTQSTKATEEVTKCLTD